ncbi:hypothetical protein BDW75DRAFT_241448 [Aspergillus navahoensis]
MPAAQRRQGTTGRTAFQLFNLITQNNSLLGTSIAQDSRKVAAASKRDRPSMKIIACLTTFFLPATCVATFFSMPLFDWGRPSIDNVATHHFWVFLGACGSAYACDDGWDRGLGGLA